MVAGRSGGPDDAVALLLDPIDGALQSDRLDVAEGPSVDVQGSVPDLTLGGGCSTLLRPAPEKAEAVGVG